MDNLQAFLEPRYLWMIAGVILIIMEFMLPGFVIIFFGAGAFLVGIACCFWDLTFNAQLITFIISSIVLLVFLRKWVKGIFVGYTSGTPEVGELTKEFIGQKAIVVSAIENGRRGKVDFHGSEWDAEADGDIAEGANVRIVGQDGIVFKVEEIL